MKRVGDMRKMDGEGRDGKEEGGEEDGVGG